MYLILFLISLNVNAQLHVYTDYILTLAGDDCLKGHELLVYTTGDAYNEAVPICSPVSEDDIKQICAKVDRCPGDAGSVLTTELLGDTTLNLSDASIGFYSIPGCKMDIICYDPTNECALPVLENGVYYEDSISKFENMVLEPDRRVLIVCNEAYTWYWSDFVTCIKLTDGTLQLSSVPTCVPSPLDYLMQLQVDVSKTDNALPFLLNGSYTQCFETAILSIFLLGVEKGQNIDLFKDYNIQPGSGNVKRDMVSGLLDVRISSLDIVSLSSPRNADGVLVKFYIYQNRRAIPPSVVTKIMRLVQRSQYDVVMESYCRLQHCSGSLNSDKCLALKVPTMQFTAPPSPAETCLYNGEYLQYGDALPLECANNEYINETDISVCLFNETYFPEELPHCGACGGLVYRAMEFKSPTQSNGNNVRGAKCVWEINGEHNIRGQFYILMKGDKVSCDEFVDYITIKEFDPIDASIINTHESVCFGMDMRLSSYIKIEYTSSDESVQHGGFTFSYDWDTPDQPWYVKYSAILISAPIVVTFFTGLVLLGVYCDHRNKRKTAVDVERNGTKKTCGDQISNGTLKPVSDQSTFYKNNTIDEEPIIPQPRIHNAVSGPEQRKRRRKKKRSSPAPLNREDSVEPESPLKPLNSWVHEHDNTRLITRNEAHSSRHPAWSLDSTMSPTQSPDYAPETSPPAPLIEEITPHKLDYNLREVTVTPPKMDYNVREVTVTPPKMDYNVREVTPPPPTVDYKGYHNGRVRGLPVSLIQATSPPLKKKRRRSRKRRTSSAVDLSTSERPLPLLNSGTAPLEDYRPLPPIESNTNTSSVVNFPYISDDLGVD